MVKRVATPGASAAVSTAVDEAPTFEICLLGQPRFSVSGKPHRFSAPPRTLPLLAYLLLHRGAHLTRENIAFALWPNDSEDEARANLRRHLHHLKEALPHAGSPWFVAEAETVGWQTQSGAWLDVDIFERLIEAQELDEAVALYAGDLLASVYDDWIIAERERLRSVFLAALEKLLRRARSRRKFAAAADCARRILENDPWREDILRQLMSIQYESGDRTGALHKFEGFAELLKRELGAEPMVETIALRDIVLRGGALPEHPDMVVSEPADVANRAPLLPFVGRARELERLHDAWTRAARGHGSIVLIGGEAGIGKSRLAAELALLAAAEGGRVFRGLTSPDDPAPYQAISEVLRDAGPLFASLDIRSIWLSVTSVLVPEVATRYNLAPPPPLDPEREQQRLFEALSQTFEALAKQRPLLVVLEDLHWAGASSLAAVEYFARRAASQSVLVVATYRSEAVAAGDLFAALRRRFASESLAGHMALSGLSLEEVGELVQFVPGLPEDRLTLARDIAQTSGGNPLFAGELIRNRIEAPLSSEIPPGISAGISARVERLSASTKLLVEIASVVGPSFDLEYVREVSGYDENAVLDGLSELLDRRMIREAAVGQFEFGFTHHLVQQTIYDGIEDRKRTWWHRRVAGVLEQLSGPAFEVQLGAVARHWELAGDTSRAAQRYLQAAQRAFSLYAYDEALAGATHALDLGSKSSELRFELLLLREEINRYRGDRSTQEHDLLELRQSSLFSADAEARCRVLERVARLRNDLGGRSAELEAIEALSEQAMPLADPRWKAVALAAKAKYHRKLGQWSMLRSTTASAAEIYERLGDASGRVAVATMAAAAAAFMADFDDADRHLASALDVARASGDFALLAKATMEAAIVANMRQDNSALQAYAIQALELYRFIGDRSGEASSHAGLCVAAKTLWQVEDARRHYKRACDLYEALGLPFELGHALFDGGYFEREVGCFDEARTLIERGAVLLNGVGATHLVDFCFLTLAEIAWECEDAPLVLRIASERLAKRFEPRNEVRWLWITSCARLELGDFDEPIEQLKNSLPKLRRYKFFDDVYDVLIELGRAYLAKGRCDDARRCVDELFQEMTTRGEAFSKVHRPRVLWLAGRVYATTHQDKRAGEMYRDAKNALEELRAAIPDEETRVRFSAIPLHREIAASH
jgi:DNA-binding SARP family transcriptional activator/tetratricopeptide (TPR) repeat protein